MRKSLKPLERKFARALAAGATSPQAWRQVYRSKCEPSTPEYQRASDLARSARVRAEVEREKLRLQKQAEMEKLVQKSGPNWDGTFEFVFRRLVEIRDDPMTPARWRYAALQVLEQIQDPTQDLNLIWRFVDTVWNGLLAHCPSCHHDFPLWRVTSEKLDEWRREQNKLSMQERPVTDLDRRLYLLRKSDRNRDPHPSQITALETPNRHIVGQGPARTGKSACLAMFGFLSLMIPGAETWLLARVFNDAERELSFILDALTTAFYPVERHMFEVVMDKKTGDAYVRTRWGAVLEVKSAKSKGSITGHELETMLVAEPGWVDADLLEEVRARMSSRLGRIIAMGSPKGFGGFLGRLIRVSTRDMRTGKRLLPGARMVENGCPWGQSIFQYHLRPADNPQYVLSELEAARGELTEAEYASEFEGRMVGETSLKFPYIRDHLLVRISRDDVRESAFVLGVDQGEKNFGGCLIAWNGEIMRVVFEYFDNTERTIKANLIELNRTIPPIIHAIGGQADHWQLTIFDADPKIDHQLLEMESEARAWRTPFTLRPKNQIDTSHWSEETCQWLNEMAKEERILFAIDRCDFLHEQLKEALIAPVDDSLDSPTSTRKRWIIYDPVRKDHVADAFLMACWTIYSNAVIVPSKAALISKEPWVEQRLAWQFQRELQEKREMRGDVNEDELFRRVFGRNRFGPEETEAEVLGVSGRGYYSDY